MSMPPLRVQHGLLFALLAGLFFAWGAWLMRGPQAPTPLPWLAGWQARVLPPLVDERLSLAALSAQVEGELWLQPQAAEQGARLLYRGALRDEEALWQVQAEVQLSDAERASLVKAVGLAGEEQPLSAQMVGQLARQPIESVAFTAPPSVPAERVAATLGQPRLRLPLPEGEAWVYPQWGLTVRVQDEVVLSLQALPKRAMQR